MIFKKMRKSGIIYKKLLMYFSISISILILILASILYSYNSNSIMDILKSSNFRFLSQISYSSTYMDNMANKLCKSVFCSNDVIAFINSDSEDIIDINRTGRSLEALAMANSYIHSVYIYNRKLDTFISTTPGTFYNSSEFFDQEIVDLMKKREQTNSLTPLPRQAANPGAYQEKPTSYTNVYTYVLYDNSVTDEMSGAIILNVKADWFRDIITSLDDKSAYKGSELFIINENGIVMSHSESTMFMKNISDQKYVKSILSSKEPSGMFIDTVNGKKYAISYVSSGDASYLLQWKFISMTPYKSVFSSVDRMRLVTIYFCILVLLLGFFFSLFASKKLYSPIGALTNRVRENLNITGVSEKGTDELSFISNAFTRISDKASELENLKRNNIHNMKNDFLKSLLLGNSSLSDSELLSKVKDLSIGLNFENKIFLFLFKIDYYKHFVEEYNEKDRSLYKYAISNIAGEIVSEHYINEVVDMGNDHFSVLINYEGNGENIDELYKNLKSVVTGIQDYVEKYFKISLSSTLGYISDEAHHLPFTYNSTLNISMYRLKYGHKCIITPSVLIENSILNFVFPASKEKILLDSLKLGNLERAKESYYDIISTISIYSYENVMASIIYLTFTIYNTANSIMENISSSFSSACSKFFTEVGDLETFEEINLVFINMFEEIVRAVNSTKNNKSCTIVNNITTIITENYFDKNLCLNSIADTLLMSSVYIGRLFKDTTGKSVAECILDKRMEKVKELLDDTCMGINDIIEKVGLEKTNYFYTTFKKYFGIPLSSYRLEAVGKDFVKNSTKTK